MINNLLNKGKFLYYTLKNDTNKKNEHLINLLKERGANVGSNVRLFSNISTPESYLINIGNSVIIASGVKIITHDNSIGIYIDDVTDYFGEINIGDNCFIGAYSIILPGVTLSNNIIVGAGSVVTKSFNEPNIVIAGNPAKKITTVNNFVEKNKKYGMNTKGLNASEKQKMILSNLDKIYKK